MISSKQNTSASRALDTKVKACTMQAHRKHKNMHVDIHIYPRRTNNRIEPEGTPEVHETLGSERQSVTGATYHSCYLVGVKPLKHVYDNKLIHPTLYTTNALTSWPV